MGSMDVLGWCYETGIVGDWHTDGMEKVILPKGSYQVRSESELKSERDNCQETIRLQLMCCAP